MHATRFPFVSVSAPEVEFQFILSRSSRAAHPFSPIRIRGLDMSDAFHDRERGFEAKFQLDEEQRFRAQARRDKLFGLWVAGQLGRGDAEAYAAEVVASNFEKPGDEDMLDKVRGDIKTAGKQISEAVLQAELNKAMTEAARQIVEASK
jgi:hypothetical protein